MSSSSASDPVSAAAAAANPPLLVDAVATRLLRPDYDAGSLALRPAGSDALLEHLGGQDPEDPRRALLSRLLTARELDELCQRVHGWTDEAEAAADARDGGVGAVVERAFAKSRGKLPTVARVSELLGEEIAARYRAALERCECVTAVSAAMPEPGPGRWTAATAERAVTLVCDVVAAHAEDADAMAAALAAYQRESRARSREQPTGNTSAARAEARQQEARALGFWLPSPDDEQRWLQDPRAVADGNGPVFYRLAQRASQKLAVLRSILQYMPRRRLSEHTLADLPRNIAAMRAYVNRGI